MIRSALFFLIAFSLPCAALAEAPPLDVTAKQLLGTAVVTPQGTRLGTVSDLLCDTLHGRIADIVVSRPGGRVAIPWMPLRQNAAAVSAITVSRAGLAAMAAPGDTLNSHPALRAVVHNLIGRAVTTADGAPAGRVAGISFSRQNGAVDALLIDSGHGVKKMPWRAIADIDLAPIVLDLDAQQFAALPAATARVASF